MYKILSKKILNSVVDKIEVETPFIASSCRAGQFVMVMVDEFDKRTPLTIADYNRERGSITLIYQKVGVSTINLGEKKIGENIFSIAGPLGKPIHLVEGKKILGIGGGVGAAPLYPQLREYSEKGYDIEVIIGGRNSEFVILEEGFRGISKDVHIMTDDGSGGEKGFVTEKLRELLSKNSYDEVISIGPLPMMKAVVSITKPMNVKTSVSLNPLMIDGTGMCGGCRFSYNGEMKFACVDGPDFDGFAVNFDELINRQKGGHREGGHSCKIGREESTETTVNNLNLNMKTLEKAKDRIESKTRNPQERIKNFSEVDLGYSLEEAISEAKRCIQCKNPLCMKGCPVSIDIPNFINFISKGNIEGAFRKIKESNNLPAICGRVCPQESQCEGKCVLGIKGKPVNIGKLERFVADFARENKINDTVKIEKNGKKIAVIGSGPASLSCSFELAKKGYEVTIFEALHEVGGVLTYGIPEFRLPKEIVKYEIENILKLGVKIEKNVIIGKTMTIKDLREKGYSEIFIGSGAGLPKFMGIEGENLNGVYSSNEFLTKINLMKAYREENTTSVEIGDIVGVIGGGNVAMDAARSAIRVGAKKVYIIYRRGENELPARVEEIHHAKEEGVEFLYFTNPVEFIGENGWIKGAKCEKMVYSTDEKNGRKGVVGSGEFVEIQLDNVIVAIGQSPNPILTSSDKNIYTAGWGGIIVNENLETSEEGVFAGGDIITGAATVILAMGAGKRAAKEMDKKIKEEKR